MQVEVRGPEQEDRPAWESLFCGYCEFYKTPVDDAKLSAVWSWIIDPSEDFHCLIAASPRPIGLVHFRSFRRPLSGAMALFVDDLFVAEENRGAGVGRLLMESTYTIARKRGYGVVRWITAADNEPARALYDAIGTETPWITYDHRVS